MLPHSAIGNQMPAVLHGGGPVIPATGPPDEARTFRPAAVQDWGQEFRWRTLSLSGAGYGLRSELMICFGKYASGGMHARHRAGNIEFSSSQLAVASGD